VQKANRQIILIISISFLVVIAIVIAGIRLAGTRNSGNFPSGDIAVLDMKGYLFSTEKYVKPLRQLEQRRDIKAIVLCIDSPGGGVAVSQELYTEISRVRDHGKIIVASISSVGASGAYMAALGANMIVANPSSVTGSIGVIVTLPIYEELLDKLGISVKAIRSGEYKGMGNPYHELLPEDSLRLQSVVDDLYEQFLEIVEKERNIPKNDLKKIADGRIFTGRQALTEALIDTLGTREDAICIAAELAGIEGRPRVVNLKKRKLTFLELLTSDYEEVLSSLIALHSLNYLWR
jgi:protease-4